MKELNGIESGLSKQRKLEELKPVFSRIDSSADRLFKKYSEIKVEDEK